MKYYKVLTVPPENIGYIAADIQGRVVVHAWVDDLTGSIELINPAGQWVLQIDKKIDLVKLNDGIKPTYMGSLEEISQELFLSLFNL